MKLTRRSFAVLCLASVAPVPGQAAEILSLDRISGYLNGLASVRSAFTQINSDGTISTGTLYMRRPGRMRFEYDPPETALVLAGAGQLAIFDGKSNQAPEQYPLWRTPLHLILKRRVDLGEETMVVSHVFDGIATSVSLQDRRRPDRGTIRLVFSGPPVELRQWVITGSDGTETTVVLGDLDKDIELAASLFNIALEVEKWKR
ncbi:MAG: outer membrane lipoprotein carrier protein LolA [Rhodobacter sp.]|nr:outer membrane lipoprotein carrier protein LolA [Rhodobacter sp.]MCY4167890.1 outer membrane lipoprotein carrier protein LolA [Rhodobacter sp.]MCY4241007.1 outer membrane lipoprotein carrier protein LolA [Rhodobacter sp.]